MDGDLVAGRYRVVRLLARGGMGEVYQAEDEELREPVALKIIRPEIAKDRRTIKRFQREVRLARKVTHPNVCRCFDVGYHRAGGNAPISFITMELLLGETLSARLKRGRLGIEEAAPLVRQMAAALGAAHRAGIVHRDFKSDNVLLVPGGDGEPLRVVVTDFGVARAVAGQVRRGSSLTAAGMKVGTPAYMAPEQVEGAPLTPAADVYALGVVLFEMVTGELPFRAASRFATAMKRLTEAPPSPRAICPELAERWERVILRCLERVPSARFGSALEVAQALEREDALAPLLVSDDAPRRWRRSTTLGAILIAAGVAIATAVLLRLAL